MYSNKLQTSYTRLAVESNRRLPAGREGPRSAFGSTRYEYRKSVRTPMHFLLDFFGRAPIWSSIETVEYRGTTVLQYVLEQLM